MLNRGIVLTVALLLVACSSDSQTSPTPAPTAPVFTEVTETVEDVVVSFKLDPRLTSGVQMGERWVTPPTFQMGGDLDVIVEARAIATTSMGRQIGLEADWSSDDPGLVGISPAQGAEVEIRIMGVGETVFTVLGEDVNKEFHVVATERDNSVWVEIFE